MLSLQPDASYLLRSMSECLEITDLMTEIYSSPMIDAFLIFSQCFWFLLDGVLRDGRQTQTTIEEGIKSSKIPPGQRLLIHSGSGE